MFRPFARVAVPDELRVRLVNVVVLDPPMVWAPDPPNVVVVGALNVPLSVKLPLNVIPLDDAPLKVPLLVKFPPNTWLKVPALTVPPPTVTLPVTLVAEIAALVSVAPVELFRFRFG